MTVAYSVHDASKLRVTKDTMSPFTSPSSPEAAAIVVMVRLGRRILAASSTHERQNPVHLRRLLQKLLIGS